MNTRSEMNMNDAVLVNGGKINVNGGKGGIRVDVCKDDENNTVIKSYKVGATDFRGLFSTILEAAAYAGKNDCSASLEMELRY